ncbi:hypothetical protein SGRA_2143 [Saprospira grandis str. Lewin]|uniref:Uncharacterized protein n=1 Tax=Saprospira grandis (strain Lewin) TaxID=984262 RepID=H6L347_SAPGL|nr:hypothetical protein SGRA_2143 [Saprospira grandis str. Lewin]
MFQDFVEKPSFQLKGRPAIAGRPFFGFGEEKRDM